MKSGLSHTDLHAFLEEMHERFNSPGFIANDPVSVPHLFERKEDIEISGFLTAIIAWGNRNSIIKNAKLLVKSMDYAPHDFVLNATDPDYRSIQNFVHRTFNSVDLLFFLRSLRMIYREYGGLETVFEKGAENNLYEALLYFRAVFLSETHEPRSEKHLANVAKNASAKRLCMFLRWMVRNDGRGVDFGLWKNIPASKLMMPLDLHTGNISRKLGLLQRKQNDWKAVEELTSALRRFDPEDPVKYDFALFGLGVTHEL